MEETKKTTPTLEDAGVVELGDYDEEKGFPTAVLKVGRDGKIRIVPTDES